MNIHFNQGVAYLENALPESFCKKILSRRWKKDEFGSVFISEIKSAKDIDSTLFETLLNLYNAYKKEQKYWPGESVSISDTGYTLTEIKGIRDTLYVDRLIAQNVLLSCKVFLQKNEGAVIEFPVQGFSMVPAPGSILIYPPYWTHPLAFSSGCEGVKMVSTEFVVNSL